MAKAKPLSAFCSYSQKDEKFRDKVSSGLSGLVARRAITNPWYDRNITAGTVWEPELLRNLQQADLVFLLISSNFIASDYCMKELALALDRHQAGKARIIPIILKAADWKFGVLSTLQALPISGEPLVRGYYFDDERMTQVSGGILKAIDEICANGSGPSAKSSSALDASQMVLAYLCNRVEQEEQLRDAWKEHFDSLDRRRRPFLCLVHGSPQEDHAGYLQRLTRYSLPQALGLESGSEIRTYARMKWPDYLPDQVPNTSLMLSSLATELNCPSTLAAVPPKLYQYGLASVVYCELSSASPSYGNRAALKSFFDFWAEWPHLPPRQKLVVVLSVQYRAGFPQRFPKVEQDIVTDAKKDGSMSAVLLDELPPVSIDHVRKWILRPEVDDRCDVAGNAAAWEAEIEDAFRDRDRIPMEQLVGTLNRMLTEFQRR